MTKEFEIGGQVVKLRATASLPLAYRLMFNRDLLRDMETYQKNARAALEASGKTLPAAAETPSGDTDDNGNANASGTSDGADDNTADNTPETDDNTGANSASDSASGADNNAQGYEEILCLNVVFIARLAYCMAKSAEPSIPETMGAWLDTIEDANAVYYLTGPVLDVYNNGFQTVSEAKKNLPPQTVR